MFHRHDTRRDVGPPFPKLNSVTWGTEGAGGVARTARCAQAECDIPVEEKTRGGGGRGRGGHGPRRPPLALPLAGVAVDGGRDARVQQLLAELQALHHASEGGRGEGGAPLQEGPRGTRGRDPGGRQQEAIPRTKASGRSRGSHRLAASPWRGRRGAAPSSTWLTRGPQCHRFNSVTAAPLRLSSIPLGTVLRHWTLASPTLKRRLAAPREDLHDRGGE